MFLQLDHLTKIYQGDNGVRSLSLTVEEGEFLTLLGPSGCGKTTTLNLIGGFLLADSGRILLDGADITHTPPERRPIATVFQNYALFPHLSVLDNVCYGLIHMRHMKKREAVEEAKRFLSIVGLPQYAASRISSLSGGEQQRVALARAMATNPKILLLDEPLSNLDAKLRVKLRQELKALQKQLQITMIFVTHDQEEALSLSDRIVVMDKGRLAQVGTPQEVYYHPQSRYVSSFIGKSNYLPRHGETILVRPEEIVLTPSKDGPFVILERTFMGSHTEYVLSDGSIRLEAELYGEANSHFQPQTQVEVQFQHQQRVNGRAGEGNA